MLGSKGPPIDRK